MKSIILSFLIIVLVSGWGGRTANPISVRQISDKNLNCAAIETELIDLETRARRA